MSEEIPTTTNEAAAKSLVTPVPGLRFTLTGFIPITGEMSNQDVITDLNDLADQAKLICPNVKQYVEAAVDVPG